MEMIVHYHLLLARLWNGLDKISHFLMTAVHNWAGRNCDYHLDAAKKELESLW